MPGAALTLVAVAKLLTDPACGGIDAGTPEGAALRDRMIAKFQVESGIRGTDLVHPFAIRDETLGASVIPTPKTRAEAVAEAARRLAAGHVLGLGLGQITGSANLMRDFRVASVADAVPLAFVPCEAVAASVRHYSADISLALRVLDCASASYNSGPGRVCQDTPYVRSVRALQAALPSAVPLAAAALPAAHAGRRAPPPATSVELLLPIPADTGTTASTETAP